jgi:CubicO group peptidase (beta-lactamase class C family)
LLVRDGRLDADAPVSRYLNGLPGWAGEITARHLAHHVAGLPAAGEIERRLADGDWTTERVLATLGEPQALSPGGTHVYSNAGYVLLAQLVAEIAGEPFDRFVRARMFEPLGLTDIGFAGPHIERFPQASLLGASRPLTVGDGGLWTSAGAFARWLEAQNRDAFDVAAIVEAPDRDGDYGWGIGLRTFRGERSFIHGGEWTGAVAKCVRCPALGLAVVALAAGPSIEALNALVEAALAE